MVYNKWKWRLVLIYLPFAILHVVLVIIDSSGFFASNEFVDLGSLILFIFFDITFLVTGFLFFNKTRRNEQLKIRWKGRFLLLAFISFTIGVLLEIMGDIFFQTSDVLRLISALFLISSAIEYYLGFFIPERLLGWLKRDEMSN